MWVNSIITIQPRFYEIWYKKFFAKLRSTPSSPTSPDQTPLSSSLPNAPFRIFPTSTMHPQPQSAPALHQKTTDSHSNLHLQFAPPKFPNRRRIKASDTRTPTSPTIVESPLELDIASLP
uniref:Uncharacterized protein n=1 Tax=Arion vulgaris TaxID=1028688 RepID=A0A0B6ZZE2_9EUPU